MPNNYMIASAVFAVATAMPATATIVIYTTPGAVQPAENVLFNNVPAPAGNNAFGRTNQTSTGVTFTSNEALATPSNGQARLTAADDGLSNLSFALTDPTQGFTEVEFNLFGSRASATMGTLTFTDQSGTVFNQDVTIGNGQNFVSARAIDNQVIANVSFTLNGDIPDVRQVRLGGFTELNNGGGLPSGVPEPAMWGLMIAGFGGIGVAMRRRRTAVAA